MENINLTLDFLIDLYKIVGVNENVLYKNNHITKDTYYKNKLGVIVNYYLNLPDDYITVSKGVVIEKSSILLHKEVVNIFCKLQKKHYKLSDKFGITKNSNMITSFYEDTDYLCDTYTTLRNNTTKFKKWIRDYSDEAVYLETEEFKFYGGKNERIVKLDTK